MNWNKRDQILKYKNVRSPSRRGVNWNWLPSTLLHDVLMKPLSQGRELKSKGDTGATGATGSPSRRGVNWNIFDIFYPSSPSEAPLAGAWIEILLYLSFSIACAWSPSRRGVNWNACSSAQRERLLKPLSQGRELKFIASGRLIIGTRKPLSQGRELK